MDKNKQINDVIVSLLNSVLKVEEQALKESANVDLSITEIHTLEAIGIGKTKTMTQVAGALKISVSTLTIAINKLVKKGYVDRNRMPEDRRIVRIFLTEKGVEVVKEHQAFHMHMVEEMTEELSDTQSDLLLNSLEILKDFFKMKLIQPLNHGVVELEPISLGKLEIPVPIFQGGMAIGISTAKLAAEVARCGGVGVIAGAQLGYTEEDFYTNPVEANLRAVKREVSKAVAAVKGVPGAGPIGFNVMAVGSHYEKMVRTAIDAGAKIIISGGGLPMALPGIVPEKDVKLIPVVSSARAASLIIRNWSKKHNRLPDAFIFEGPKAGGHLGFKEEQLEIAEENFYKTILEMKDILEEFPECKLIVAGGIFDREDVEKALRYGADGVQLGTRFVATEECEAPEAMKQAYVDCNKNDCVIIKSPVGMLGRVLNNKFVQEVALSSEKQQITRCNNCMHTCNVSEASYCLTEALVTTVKGDVDNGLVFMGSDAHRIESVVKVKDIFDELTGKKESFIR